nr:Ground region domain containing protein [Haemonchus contortus]
MLLILILALLASIQAIFFGGGGGGGGQGCCCSCGTPQPASCGCQVQCPPPAPCPACVQQVCPPPPTAYCPQVQPVYIQSCQGSSCGGAAPAAAPCSGSGCGSAAPACSGSGCASAVPACTGSGCGGGGGSSCTGSGCGGGGGSSCTGSGCGGGGGGGCRGSSCGGGGGGYATGGGGGYSSYGSSYASPTYYGGGGGAYPAGGGGGGYGYPSYAPIGGGAAPYPAGGGAAPYPAGGGAAPYSAGVVGGGGFTSEPYVPPAPSRAETDLNSVGDVSPKEEYAPQASSKVAAALGKQRSDVQCDQAPLKVKYVMLRAKKGDAGALQDILEEVEEVDHPHSVEATASPLDALELGDDIEKAIEGEDDQSGLSLTDAKCNSKPLRNLILQNIARDDALASKRAIHDAAQKTFPESTVDVICSGTGFTYLVSTTEHCEAQKDNVICFVYKRPLLR